MPNPSPTGLFVGRSTLDLVYACARFPEPDGKVDAEASYIAGGGPALNGAVAFAALGGRARLLSAVGEGAFAEAARADLTGQGVELLDAAAGAADILPVSSIVLTGQARAIVNPPLPEVSRALAPELLERAFETPPAIVLSDGHRPELALPVLARAKAQGAPTVLDGGAWKPWTAELLPLIDVAIVSSRFRPPEVDGDVLDWLAARFSAAAITNGPHPTRWRAGGASGEIAPPKVRAVDTLGAGDIFHGAFCHAFASDRNFTGALAFAGDIAARSCASFGPRRWIAGV